MAITEIIFFFFPFVLVLGEIFIPSIILVFADDFQTTPANEHNNERGKRKAADKVAHGTDGCVGCVGGTDVIENQNSENCFCRQNFSPHKILSNRPRNRSKVSNQGENRACSWIC